MSFLSSERIGKRIFAVTAIAHFLLYVFIGIFWLVEIDKDFYLSSSYTFLAVDFRLGVDVYNVFKVDPGLLYATSFHEPFLNLPAFMGYVILWIGLCQDVLLLDLYSSVVLYAFGLFAWNVLNCFLIYKIMTHVKYRRIAGNSIFRNPFIAMSLYIGVSFHFFEYYIGQHNIIVASFLLLAVYYFLNDKSHLSAFILGVGLNFKLTVVFFIMVLILYGSFKKLAKNIVFLALSQVPNIIMFLVWPGFLSGFLANNFARLSDTLMPNTPANIASFLFIYYGVDIKYSIIIVACLVLPLTLYVLYEYRDRLNLFDKIILVMLLAINITPAYWGNHMLITLGVFWAWVGTKNQWLDKNIGYIKLVLAIPCLSLLLWLVFPYYSFLFFAILITYNLVVISSKKSSV